MAKIDRLWTQLRTALIGLALSGGAGVAIALTIPVAPTTPAPRAAPVAAAMTAVPVPADPYAVRGVLTLDGPLAHGAYAWDDSNVADGPVFVTIDLKAETLSVFRGGYEIGVAAILFGTDAKPTPLGQHAVRWKKARHVSSLYDAPMPYTLNLTGDGVAIHGSDVDWGAATHGCIGVPVEFARLLFAQVKVGDPVIVTSGKMMALPAA